MAEKEKQLQEIEILEKFRNKKVAIFIDDANLFYMQKRIA